MKSSLLLSIVFLSLTSFAAGDGGWISSGGESFHDAKNPWFLRRAHISYCTEIDASSFATDGQEIEKSVLEAIDYWQGEFSKESGPVLGHERKSFKLGQNIFEKSQDTGCNGTEDLRFLFGQDTLSEKERAYLSEGSQSYVGVAVRTDYDRKKLRGRGFIYIASDKDIDAYSLSKDTIKKPWQHPKLLKLALIHELGHVFGIPHMGTSLMSEVFMDILLSKYYYLDFIKSPIESFVSSERELERCTFLTPDMVNFFGLRLKTSCLRIKWNDSKSFDIFAVVPKEEPEKVASVVSLQIDFFGIESRPLAFLRLTPEQQIFTPAQVGSRSLVAGPLQERFNMKGKIIIYKTFKSYPLQLSLSPESFILTSVLNDKLMTIFSYESPFSSILGQTLDLKL